MGSRVQKQLLQPGQLAPAISALPLDGKQAVIAFFKSSCPVCQYTFPFLERLHKSGVPLRGISQDNDADSAGFAAEFGITFPMVRDPAEQGFRASNDYGISHVPSIFLIEPDGKLAMAWDGFSKADMEELAGRFSAEVFGPGEKVPQWKPG